MGYDITQGIGLNFGEGRSILLQSFVPKRQIPDYYHKSRRGLGYIITPLPSSTYESKEEVQHDHSFESSSWDLEISEGATFCNFIANMISINHIKEGYESTSLQNDSWAKHLNMKWETQFE